METFKLDSDITVFVVPAFSFPQGIKQAFGELVQKLHTTDSRTFFGISYQGEGGEMVYLAAVQEAFAGEGKKLGCETFVIEKGNYLAATVKAWQTDELQIGRTFRELSNAGRPCTFPCVEWYEGADVRCMVRLADEE